MPVMLTADYTTGRHAPSYDEAVEEALCYGWVDSTYRSLDDERGMNWYSPRRRGSLWSASNKERVARLEADGRMTDAGRAAIERAKADGSWSTLEPVEALTVPDDLSAAFGEHVGAWQAWATFTAASKRAYLLWIVTAKRAATRTQRVEQTASAVAQGTQFDDR